jgi:hypothetical protein
MYILIIKLSPTKKKSPKWSFSTEVKIDDEVIRKKNEIITSKISRITESWNKNGRKKFNDDLILSYDILYKNKNSFAYHKVIFL